MRYIIRILVIALALVVVFLTPLFVVSSAAGTTIEPAGALIDAVALIAIAASLFTWRRRAVAA